MNGNRFNMTVHTVLLQSSLLQNNSSLYAFSLKSNQCNQTCREKYFKLFSILFLILMLWVGVIPTSRANNWGIFLVGEWWYGQTCFEAFKGPGGWPEETLISEEVILWYPDGRTPLRAEIVHNSYWGPTWRTCNWVGPSIPEGNIYIVETGSIVPEYTPPTNLAKTFGNCQSSPSPYVASDTE